MALCRILLARRPICKLYRNNGHTEQRTNVRLSISCIGVSKCLDSLIAHPAPDPLGLLPAITGTVRCMVLITSSLRMFISMLDPNPYHTS